MSQNAKRGDKKGAKTSSQIGQSMKVSQGPAEESKGSGQAQKAKTAQAKRLRKNLDEKVAAQGRGSSAQEPSSEARQTTKSAGKVPAKGTLDAHLKPSMAKAESRKSSSKPSPSKVQNPLTTFFKPQAQALAAEQPPTPALQKNSQPTEPQKPQIKPTAPADTKMKDETMAKQGEPQPKSKGSTTKQPKQPKPPKVEPEIPAEVLNWKQRSETTFTVEMAQYIEVAQKERETWRQTLANSNSNPMPAQSPLQGHIGGNSHTRTENISDDNFRLLCQKIRENHSLQPSEDSVMFLIVKCLASHIEQSTFNQVQLVDTLRNYFTDKMTAIFTEPNVVGINNPDKQAMQTFLNKIDFDRALLQSAQRKAYGAAPRHHDLYADETPEAIWSWELATPSLYLEPPAFLRDVISHRETMQSLASVIQSLQKLLHHIQKAKQLADLTQVSASHAKYIKLVQKRNEMTTKLQAKAIKEHMRAQKEEEKRRQVELERQEKENERLAKEQERSRAKQMKELALLQERQEKERVRELEKKQKEDVKEKERLAKEHTREQERLEREAAKERERIEKEDRRKLAENERVERKRKQEEDIRLAQEARDQQKREKEEREAALRAAKDKQKLTNFFNNSGGAGGSRAPNGVQSAQLNSTAINGSQNKKLIGGNQITNDVRQAPLLDQQSQQESEQCFKDYSVLTEAHQIQRAFRLRFAMDALKPRPEYTSGLLKQTMQIYSSWHTSLMPSKRQAGDQSDSSAAAQSELARKAKRPKCIIIEDSHSNFHGRLDKRSTVITARNPFKKDEDVLDYDMDSEDEWAEQNGEDLDKKEVEEDQEDEDMASEEGEEAGFIVSDGHLSVCEYDFSQDGDENDESKLKEITLRRERVKQQRQQMLQPTAENGGPGNCYCITESSSQSGHTELLKEFTVVTFGSVSLPLSCKKPEKVYELGQGDPNAILRFRPQLIRACYASLESKQQIIDVFNDKYPECSKKSIERIFKEIIIKEKREGDLRPAWYACEDILKELPDFNSASGAEELLAISKERMRPLVEEAEQAEAAKNEEQKIRDELKRLEQEKRAAEREQKEREKQLEREKIQQQKETERQEREAQKESERQLRELEKQRSADQKEKQRLEELQQKAAEKERKRLERETLQAQRDAEEEARKAEKAAEKLAKKQEKEEATAKAKAEKDEHKRLKNEQKEQEKARKEAEKEAKKKSKEKKPDNKQMSLDASLKTATVAPQEPVKPIIAPSSTDTSKPEVVATENRKRPEAPQTADQLLQQIIQPVVPEKLEQSGKQKITPQTGSAKKLDKKQVKPQQKAASVKKSSQEENTPPKSSNEERKEAKSSSASNANGQKASRKRESKAKDKTEKKVKKTTEKRSESTKKKPKKEQQLAAVNCTESEDTNKLITMPSSSEKKQPGQATGTVGEVVQQPQPFPVSKKKIQLQDAVMQAATSPAKDKSSKAGSLLQLFKQETPKKGSQVADHSQVSAASARKQQQNSAASLKQGSLLSFVKK